MRRIAKKIKSKLRSPCLNRNLSGMSVVGVVILLLITVILCVVFYNSCSNILTTMFQNFQNALNGVK